MLALSYRLNKTKDIERTLRKGASYFYHSLVAKILNNELAVNRFTIITSAKVSKKAVVRNKYKRQAREIIRSENKHLKGGHDVAIIILPTIIKAKKTDLKIELKKAFQKAKLYQ